MVEICLCLISLVGFIFGLLWRQKNVETFLTYLPGPTGNFILGNLLDFKSASEILETLHRYNQTYGNIIKFKLGPFLTSIVAADAKFIGFILSNNNLFEKSKEYKITNKVLGNGLLLSTGDQWKKRRQLLNPVFGSRKYLENCIPVFNKHGNALVENFKSIKNKNSVNVASILSLCTLDNVCETSGINIQAQKQKNKEYVFSLDKWSKIIVKRAFSPLKRFDFFYKFTPDYQTELNCVEVLNAKTNEIIQNQKGQNNEKNTKTILENPNFLDLLMNASIDGKKLSDKIIVDEINTFIFGGHATTAAALSFCLYCLSQNPKIETKVYEEQKTIFGIDFQRCATTEDLHQMKYLEMVIKETLRLYPPLCLIAKTAISDNVSYENQSLPKNATIFANIFSLHRNPQYYENPEEFKPERFENDVQRVPFSFLPFGGGQRNCIGQKFAMLELKITLSILIKNFKVETTVPVHNVKLSSNIVLSSTNGVLVKLLDR